MNLTLKVWRQKNSNTPGRFEAYQAAVLGALSALQ